ncbi:U4/U6.U5 tri-snRNP component SNU23 [Blastomyces parvus]|uniref:U4/U6.U5 tri-snRNP component SNU23 n=1 Tax=Blastomyces parvus TaxID=2060905 RepID=A0A2B7WKR8_9EURO|nr:U4/U6.U5 tri-snRNP component SNU23 [Blastomyces parvus]
MGNHSQSFIPFLQMILSLVRHIFQSTYYGAPFGLVLKWTDRANVEEAMAMQLTRKAGMPVPKVLCSGEHPASFNRSFSILMTRPPGLSLENSYDPFEVDVEWPWINELKMCLQSMRLWQGPENRICSAIGTSIRNSQVPGHVMGPFESEAELHEYLLGPASMQGFKSTEEYEEMLSRARKIQQQLHRITFTHGNFKVHNILVDDGGHLSDFLIGNLLAGVQNTGGLPPRCILGRIAGGINWPCGWEVIDTWRIWILMSHRTY